MSHRILAGFVLFLFAGAIAEAQYTHHPDLVFTFVENKGQADATVRYLGSGLGFKAWFTNAGFTLRHGDALMSAAFVRDSANGTIRTRADKPIGGSSNYLVGNDPGNWRTGLPLFTRISYSGVWSGVDLTYRAEHERLKAEYRAAPGADVSRIMLRFDGQTQISADGSLLIHAETGDFVEQTPILFQWERGIKREIAGGFRKLPDGSIGFWTGRYDRRLPLIIDPVILLSGYFGGSSEDNITAIATDSLNNIVIAGWTSSTNLPSSGGYQKKYGGSADAFVASFQPNGGGLNYCTYIGGAGNDEAFALAIDSARNVYVTGQTSSTNFPVLGAIQSRLSGARDAFVVKLNPAGNALVYSTYLGGLGVDVGYGIGLNNTNQAIVVGDTTSTNFPVTSATIQSHSGGGQDAFVAVLSSAGNVLTFSTYLGGNSTDHASSVAVGPSGGIFVGGYTWSTNFPVVNAQQPYSLGAQQGFVAKISPQKAKFDWSTYLGGSDGAPQEVTSVRLDQTMSVNVVVGGVTSSTNFPVTPGAFQTALAGETDGFVAHLLNSSGQILQATYLGGSLGDSVTGATTDPYGDIYVTGATSSPDFPVQWPFQSANAGMMDAFVAKFNDSLSTLIFSTYLGGSGSDQANAIAVDAETSIIVAGQTGSANYPVTGSSLDNYMPSLLTSFLTKIRPNFTLGVAYPNASQMEFTADPWHVMSDTASTYYGLSSDVPIVGDWTGTGVKRIGIFRNGTWILDTNGDGILDAGDQTVSFGQAGDIPVVGDWRGTGHIALGLYRKGTFILDYSGHLSGSPTGLNDITISNFGLSTDIPIVSDWNGSGTAKVGVFRNGAWLIDYNGTGVISQTYTYGQAGDIPVVGDWDSSHNPPKIGVYRSGIWVLNYTGNNVWGTPGMTEMSLGFGFPGYTPLIF